MIEKYIYAVTSRLPENSRKEIGEEIRELISDMMEDIHEATSEEERVYKTLEKLGNPDLFADKYRGKERYLIGPKYINKYIFIMKIVLLSIFIGISVAVGVGVIFSIDNMGEIISNYIGTLFSALLQGAAWVTGTFAFLEYKGVPIDKVLDNQKWEPSKLPQVPNKKSIIPKSEPIFSIIMSTIFFSLFYYVPEYLVVYYNGENKWNGTNIFNLNILESFNIMIIAIFSLTIISELIKIIASRWSVKVSIIYSLINVISSALLIKIISSDLIWNNDIIQKIEKYTAISFDKVILVTILFIVIITIIDNGVSLYKGFKYGD
ncbi:hypothetical protein [Clostridium sp.]|uniref:hypothetical protein n=1 Tax=Clostridium sp. TaxID=1506 RepID=UPI00262E4EE9|nr:hypothetical protein [Clostridium sp.]